MKKAIKINLVLLLLIIVGILTFKFFYDKKEDNNKQNNEIFKKISLDKIEFDVMDYDDMIGLSSEQIEKYKELVEGIKTRKTELSISDSYDENLLLLFLIKENPLSFLIDEVKLSSNKKIIKIKYTNNEDNHQKYIDYVTNEYKKILNDIIYEHYNDVDKILAIYRYFSNRINYDYEWYESMKASKDAFNFPEIKIYEALQRNMGVCHSYSYLIQLALHQFGIQSINTIGDIKGEDESHSWLRIKIGEKFYHFDATWDSGESSKDIGQIGLNYFGMTDEERNSKKEFTWIFNNIEIKSEDKTFEVFRDVNNFEFTNEKHIIKTYGWLDEIKYFDTSKLKIVDR